ncbi:DUF3352 domain-containing protein [Ekhidna sp.]|uniref:DUF3352 domain-containing protein n=1 Tax=Ekhidna sp. TaxID=2608089 RepID=UPI003297BE50
MKKLLISIALLLLAGAGYFTYEKWVKHSDLTIWSFIPADAAVVVDAKLVQDLKSFQGYSISTFLKESSGLKNFRNGISFLDSINGEGGFTAIFQNAPAVASAHKVSSSEVDFLFVIELQNISQNTFANAAIGRLQERGYRFKTRNYNDFKISEISNQGKTLTFIFYKNFFLASFTPYLVEDAVRAISDEEMLSFQENFTQLSKLGTNGLASVYVNYEKFGELIGAFTSNGTDFSILAGNYDLMLDSSFIQLSGFSYTKDGWLSTHKNQPAPFEMAEVVPENTAYFYHITSMDFSNWKEAQINYLRSSDTKIKVYQDSLKALFDFNADQVFDLIDNEIGIANLESPRSRDQQKLLILEVKDRDESLSFFSQLTERVALARNDSVYRESYSENEIRFLPIGEFPSTILGSLAEGFEQCFYIGYRNYLIFSNDLQELKNLIFSIQNEDTWGKSISMNNFLERANNSANVSLFVNIPRAWSTFQNQLKPDWSDHFKENATLYKTMDMAAFQYSYIDGRYFTNYTFNQPIKQKKSIPKTRAENGLRFISKLNSKAYLLKTHAHKNYDILVQDSTNTIYYMDPDQNTLWSQNVEEPIQGGIYPIDYYKNGKIQYVFATSKNIYMVDRTGAYIPGYPKSFPKTPTIQHLNLIDYDLSRNYRMAVTDIDGGVYLTDKDLNVLDGWNPKNLNRRALLPLEHARLGRSDVMISIQENGVINLMNRRGQFIKGFPFDTRQTLDKNYHLRKSNSLSNSSLTVISKGGELTEINLEGDVIKRHQLIKTSADATFQLVPDTGGDSFIIIRKEGNTYEVLDDTGNLLFKKDYLSQETILIQYYQFGAGKDLVIFTDTSNKSLYIYDKSGNLVTGNPLNSEHEISLIYSSAKREFQVFTTWDANLELYNFAY